MDHISWVQFLLFFLFSVWGTYPCYLLRFGAKTCSLLSSGAKISHARCAPLFLWFSLILPWCSCVFDAFGWTLHGLHSFFHSVHGIFDLFCWFLDAAGWFLHVLSDFFPWILLMLPWCSLSFACVHWFLHGFPRFI